MNFLCQSECITQLKNLAQTDRHSLLIAGPAGCGKSYLANQFAKTLGIDDFQLIMPKVLDIRQAIDQCTVLNNRVVICIENLDMGVAGAAFTLLKFLEEPMSHVYIVVTCRNLSRVPDTIISRSSVMTLSNPRFEDLDEYCKGVHTLEYPRVKQSSVWNCCRTFNDIDTICKMTKEQLDYFDNKLPNMLKFTDSVSNIVWSLGHYPDNSETPVELVIQYILNHTLIHHIKMSGIECLKDIASGRIAKHTVLTKFAFECKYIE